MSSDRPKSPKKGDETRVGLWWARAQAVQLEGESKNTEIGKIDQVLAQNKLSRHGFDQATYLALLPLTKLILEEEEKQQTTEQRAESARAYAAKLTILFGDANTAVEYLKRYDTQGSKGNKLLHDACLFVLPQDNEWDVAIWRKIINAKKPMNPNDLVLRILPLAAKIQVYIRDHEEEVKQKIAEFVREEYRKKYSKNFDEMADKEEASKRKNETKEETIKRWMAENAPEINALIKSRCGEAPGKGKGDSASKKTSLLHERTPIAVLESCLNLVCYKNADKNPEVAYLFFKNMIAEESFEKYLTLVPKDDATKIPDIMIECSEISDAYKGFYIKKLSPHDPRAAILGKYTSCCQKLGDAGEEPAVFGIEDPNAGFYVLFRRDNKGGQDVIVSQCLAFRNGDNMVFDSIETEVQSRQKYATCISDSFLYLANELVSQHGILRVNVGVADISETPKCLTSVPEMNSVAPIGYEGYRDSHRQAVLADQAIGSFVFQLYVLNETHSALINHQAFLNCLRDLSVNDVLALVDLCPYTFNPAEVFDFLASRAGKLGMDKDALANRFYLCNEWVNLFKDINSEEFNENLEIEKLSKYILSGIDITKHVLAIGVRNDHEVGNPNMDQAHHDQDITSDDGADEAGDKNVIVGYENAWFVAAQHSKWELVKFILEKLNDLKLTFQINAESSCDGLSLLAYALAEKNFVIAEGLLKQGAQISVGMLHRVVLQNNFGAVRWMVEHGADVNERYHNTLVLHSAVSDGNLEMVDYLISCGADINATLTMSTTTCNSSGGSTHIEFEGSVLAHFMDCENKFDMLMKLLSSGADPNTVSPGQSLLSNAIKCGREDVALLLLAHGADVNKLDYHRQSPLDHAFICGSTNLLILLLNAGAKLSEPSLLIYKANSLAPLWRHNLSLELVQSLVQAGYEVSVNDVMCAMDRFTFQPQGFLNNKMRMVDVERWVVIADFLRSVLDKKSSPSNAISFFGANTGSKMISEESSMINRVTGSLISKENQEVRYDQVENFVTMANTDSEVMKKYHVYLDSQPRRAKLWIKDMMTASTPSFWSYFSPPEAAVYPPERTNFLEKLNSPVTDDIHKLFLVVMDTVCTMRRLNGSLSVENDPFVKQLACCYRICIHEIERDLNRLQAQFYQPPTQRP